MLETSELSETPQRLPSCLVPTFHELTELKEEVVSRSSVSASISGQWNAIASSFRTQGVTMPAIMKTAWTLTLQCYVSSEVACFEYYGPDGRREPDVNGNGVNSHRACSNAQTSNATLCLLRLNKSENLFHFLRRMSSVHTTRSAFVPDRNDIIFVFPVPTTKTWNTAIQFQDKIEGISHTYSSDAPAAVTITVEKSAVGQLSTRLEYSCDVIGKDLATSILDTFGTILTSMLTNPHMPIHQIDTCSPRDRQRIRAFTQNVAPAERSLVHGIIARQCRLSPDRTAICSWEGEMTYAELDDLSCRLAHHLVHIGITAETFVFSCFEKSMWAVVTRLAILRAGGAYVSIHAASPLGYLEAVVQRTGSKLLVTTPKFKAKFEKHVDHVLAITPEFMHGLPRYDAPPMVTVGPDNACLVLFTSGSTGEPKGIIQTHQSYSTAILNYVENLGLGPHTRFFHFDDYSFDISNLEFMTPLFIGGCCCVPHPPKSIGDLVDGMRLLRANISFLTPTVAIRMDPSSVTSLDAVCLGGELLPTDLITRWAASGIKLVNQYGMGEVAVCCTLNQDVRPERSENVGRPVSGVVWVVDADTPDRLMPIGAVGELLVEGPHLSRGYLDQISHRSEAVFIEKAPGWMHELHPDRISSRLYRSGDLGRLLHDGTIQHLGRKDTVLKLDGCLVDALEVELQIRKCLTSNDAVIVDLLGVIDGVADPVLSAFVYLHDHPYSTAPLPEGEPLMCDAEIDTTAASKVNEIKDYIRNVLPSYRIPQRWFLVSWVMRTASNKTDRKRFHVVGQKMFMEHRQKDDQYEMK